MNCFLTFFLFHFPLALLSGKIALMYTFKIIRKIVFSKTNKQGNSLFLTFADDTRMIL